MRQEIKEIKTYYTSKGWMIENESAKILFGAIIEQLELHEISIKLLLKKYTTNPYLREKINENELKNLNANKFNTENLINQLTMMLERLDVEESKNVNLN